MTTKNQKQSGHIYNIKGGIQAGRDVVMGDQAVYIQNITNIHSPNQFVEELQKLEMELEKLKKLPSLTPARARAVATAQAKVNKAIIEAKKPAPLGERINKTLDGAKQTMERLGGSIGAAIGLGAALAQLAELALKLFAH